MSTDRLSSDLAEILGRGEGGLSLREVAAAVGERGYGLLLIILAMPSAMPVPAPGYSTPFGIALFLIGLQIVAGRRTPWLPQWVLSRRLTAETGRRMVAFLARFFGRIERWIRPRHEWIFGRGGRWLSGLLVLGMATLMIFPIPLTNTAPAGVIFLIGIGLLEKDGALLGFATVLGCLAVLFYLASFYAILFLGLHGMEEVKEIIRGWFGS